ncbi:MAG: flagellar hook-length control protein FliK [Planctomycetota bacterium]
MDRTSPAPGIARPAATAAAGDVAPAPRQLPVHAGQSLQATVVAQDGAAIWLGYRGGVFLAQAAFALEPGRTYEFVVARTEPHIELARAAPARQPTALPPLASMRGADLFALLARLQALEPAGGAPADPAARVAADAAPGDGLPQSLRGALAQCGDGRPSAAALQAIDRGLGHDQEARVLRLLPLTEAAQRTAAAELRDTAKARALRQLEAAASPEPAAARGDDVARLLAAGLSQVERDNAARRELGAPLWLPLPASPEAGLLDARMFLMPDAGDGGAGAAPGDRPFTIVLLLDLTRLGALRVDVTVRGDAVDATFVAARADAAAALLGAIEPLRQDLRAGGLEPGSVRVLQAPPAGLPVVDLVLPPRDGSAMVDLHA